MLLVCQTLTFKTILTIFKKSKLAWPPPSTCDNYIIKIVWSHKCFMQCYVQEYSTCIHRVPMVVGESGKGRELQTLVHFAGLESYRIQCLGKGNNEIKNIIIILLSYPLQWHFVMLHKCQRYGKNIIIWVLKKVWNRYGWLSMLKCGNTV